MKCTKPISIKVNGYPEGLLVPCGKCLSCRITKRTEWSVRMLHELDCWQDAMFLTLTYKDESLPENFSLKKKHLQLFIKMLRKRMDIQGRKIKYFGCGEYGKVFGRPHYHLIIFGLSLKPEDKLLVMECWPYCDWTIKSISDKSFGVVEPDSIRYTAKYVEKIKSGGELEEYNNRGVENSFMVCSKGIGKDFAKKEKERIIENGFITMNGVKHSVPRYYVKILEIDTDYIKVRAQEEEIKEVEETTGLYNQFDDVLKTNDSRLINKLYEGILKKRKQRNSNIVKRLEIKESTSKNQDGF